MYVILAVKVFEFNLLAYRIVQVSYCFHAYHLIFSLNLARSRASHSSLESCLRASTTRAFSTLSSLSFMPKALDIILLACMSLCSTMLSGEAEFGLGEGGLWLGVLR